VGKCETSPHNGILRFQISLLCVIGQSGYRTFSRGELLSKIMRPRRLWFSLGSMRVVSTRFTAMTQIHANPSRTRIAHARGGRNSGAVGVLVRYKNQLLDV
jgi:hypothetical protein